MSMSPFSALDTNDKPNPKKDRHLTQQRFLEPNYYYIPYNVSIIKKKTLENNSCILKRAHNISHSTSFLVLTKE